MPIGLLTGLAAALSWGAVDVASALGSRRIGSLRVVVGAQVVSLVILAGLVFATGTDPFAMPPETLALALGLGVIASLAYLAFFTGLRIGPIAVVSPTVAAYGGLTVVLAVLIRGETLTGLQAVGAAVATVGVVLTGVAFDGGWRGVRMRGGGVAFAIVALVLFAVLTIVMATPIRQVGWLPVIVVERIGNVAFSVGLLAVVVATRSSVFGPLVEAPEPDGQGTLWLVVAAGVLDVVGFIAFAYGLEVAEVWLVGLASSFGPAVAVVVAVGLLGERLRPVQWVGLAALALGLVAIALP
jgi:drug/metabolite transporter (DMT)-like permease